MMKSLKIGGLIMALMLFLWELMLKIVWKR